jgi:hypothetical protein
MFDDNIFNYEALEQLRQDLFNENSQQELG